MTSKIWRIAGGATLKSYLSLSPEDGGVLNPHEKIDLTLTFCPKSIGKVAAKLNIKVLTEEDEIIEVFTIPIKGETLDLPISVSGM